MRELYLQEQEDKRRIKPGMKGAVPEEERFKVIPSEEIVKNYVPESKNNSFEARIVRESNFAVLKYILSHLDLRKINKILLTFSHDFSSRNLVNNVKYVARTNNVRAVVDLKKVNNNGDLNKYFASINDIIPGAGIYIGCVETHRQRNKRIYAKKKKIIAALLIFFEFIFHRILPKIGLFRGLYLTITGGKAPVLSLAETLGRLIYCGFDVIEYKTIRNLTYFVVMKTREPNPETGPNTGLFVKTKWFEKDGKVRGSFSLRIYHAYSQYVPDHVLKLNGSGTTITTPNDFRYNVIGRMLYGPWKDDVLGYVKLAGESVRDFLKTVRQIRLFPGIEPGDVFYIKFSLGKGGKHIKIYKFRTMVKNAEQLDNLIVEYNSYGNPVKDTRVTPLGRFMRKVWIDELPQLYSLIKGDIKLVGIRPMRECDWRRYPVELKEKAMRFRPGLMGIQYGSLIKHDFKEHLKFFNDYLDQKTGRPFWTDVRYFFRILYYIFFKGVRTD